MEERKKHFERPTMQRPPSIINITLLSVALGLMAGISGYLIARYYFPVTDSDYINLFNTDRNIRIDLEQPLTSISAQNTDSVAGVYRPVLAQTGVGEPLFSDDDLLGSAVVVTSDGWLMTTNQVVESTNVLVALQDEIYEVLELKEDPFSNTVFIRIDSNSLQPVDFQLADSLRSGERLYTNVDIAHSVDHAFFTSVLSNTRYFQETYQSSDAMDYYMLIEDESGIDFINTTGAPYFNLDGDLVGLHFTSNAQDVLLPAEYLRQAVRHLLADTERPTLGVRYIDLENNVGFNRRGVLIYHPTTNPIISNSPASRAGLRSSDQIVAINDQIISESKTLTAIIQNYRQGDTVVAKVFRDGSEIDIEIKL